MLIDIQLAMQKVLAIKDTLLVPDQIQRFFVRRLLFPKFDSILTWNKQMLSFSEGLLVDGKTFGKDLELKMLDSWPKNS